VSLNKDFIHFSGKSSDNLRSFPYWLKCEMIDIYETKVPGVFVRVFNGC